MSDCVVVLREDRPGDQRLVAYYVAPERASGVEHSKCGRHLQSKLPDYMVPQHFVELSVDPADAQRQGGPQGASQTGSGKRIRVKPTWRRGRRSSAQLPRFGRRF